MSIIGTLDRNFVFNQDHVGVCENLFDPQGDWRVAKAASSAIQAETIESYAIDRAHAREIPRQIIAQCLTHLGRSAVAQKVALELPRELCEAHPVECGFFRRVVQRKRAALSEQVARAMPVELETQRLQNIWEHSINITSMPPATREFREYRRQWEITTLQRTFVELDADYFQDTTLNAFSASAPHQREINQKRKAGIWQFFVSLFSWQRIANIFQRT